MNHESIVFDVITFKVTTTLPLQQWLLLPSFIRKLPNYLVSVANLE